MANSWLPRYFCSGLLLLCTAAHAQENYTISFVYDGDTVQLNSSAGKFKLRLADIDAPERNQPYGLKSRRALMQLCMHSKIDVEISGQDQYSRSLGKLHCNGVDAGLHLVENGYAWLYRKQTANAALKNAFTHARNNKMGLWQDVNATPPWVWRHQYHNTNTPAR